MSSPSPAVLQAPLRPETRLLFLTARGREADAEIVQLGAAIGNWPWFIAITELERATRIVWERLASLGALPPRHEGGQQLEQLATIAGFRAEHLRVRLQETLAALAAAGIDVVLLKGAALATTVYRSFLERPMGDLDLLVSAADARRAHEIARTAGWTWDNIEFPFSRYEGHHHLPPLEDAAGTGVRLELHTGLAIEGHPFALGMDALVQRGRRISVGSASAIVPSLEHLLLHEAVHFAWSHVLSFGSWRTVRDVQLMTASGKVDWEAFVADCKAHRAESCAYWTLSLAHQLAGATVPEDAARSLRPPMSAFKERLLRRHFMYHLLPIAAEWPSEKLRRTLWEKAIQPERHGHGGGRPWELDERGPEPALGAVVPRPTASIGDRLARLGVWARYVRTLS